MCVCHVHMLHTMLIDISISPMNPYDPSLRMFASQMAAGSPCGAFCMTCCSKRSSCTKAAPNKSYGYNVKLPEPRNPEVGTH